MERGVKAASGRHRSSSDGSGDCCLAPRQPDRNAELDRRDVADWNSRGGGEPIDDEQFDSPAGLDRSSLSRRFHFSRSGEPCYTAVKTFHYD